MTSGINRYRKDMEIIVGEREGTGKRLSAMEGWREEENTTEREKSKGNRGMKTTEQGRRN